MKLLYSFAMALLLLPCLAAAQDAPEDRYIAIYDLIQQADQLSDSGSAREAQPKYKEAQSALKRFQNDHPDWNTKIVKFRLNYLATKINPLESGRSVSEASIETAAPLRSATASLPEASDSVRTLQEQLRQAQLEKADLERQLREVSAGSAAASADAKSLAAAQSRIRALQEDNDRLKSNLKKQSTSTGADDETVLMERATRALADAKAKLAEQSKLVSSLTQQNQTLSKRLEAVTVDTTGSSQIASLQQQLRDAEADRIALQAQLKEAQARAGGGEQLSKAEERIKNLQKENNLLRASLEQRPSQTISTADSFGAEQNKQSLADLKKQMSEQAAQIATLVREKEILQKRLDSVVNTDAVARELADTKKELVDIKIAYNKLKRRYDTQTEAAVVLITEYKLKIRQQGKAGENMTRQLDDLKRQMADAGGNLELIATLRTENEILKKQNAELRERAAKTGSADTNEALLAVQTKIAALQSQLDVLLAKAVPYSDEELALLKKSETPAAGDKKSSGKLPPGGMELVAEAQRLFAARKLEEAEEKYKQVLKLDPNNVFTLANLATIQIERDDLVTAEKNLQKAMKLDPKDAFTLGVRGNMLLRVSKYDEAFDVLSRASQLDPNSVEILNSLAITLSHKGQRGPAENTLRKILQLDPNYGNAHNNLAVIYVTQDPPLTELARWHYQKALSLGVARNSDLEKLLETLPPDAKK